LRTCTGSPSIPIAHHWPLQFQRPFPLIIVRDGPTNLAWRLSVPDSASNMCDVSLDSDSRSATTCMDVRLVKWSRGYHAHPVIPLVLVLRPLRLHDPALFSKQIVDFPVIQLESSFCGSSMVAAANLPLTVTLSLNHLRLLPVLSTLPSPFTLRPFSILAFLPTLRFFASSSLTASSCPCSSPLADLLLSSPTLSCLLLQLRSVLDESHATAAQVLFNCFNSVHTAAPRS
jgi:hypothetical protein